MFKQIMTLIRGQAHVAEETFTNRHALPILSQQIREAARGVETARKAVALAMAQNRLEKENADRLAARITDLESRAMTALEKDRQDLALEAARSIASLETELENNRRAISEFGIGIERLKQAVRQSELRLASLQRGERLAVARDRTQRLTRDVPASELSTLTDAEATLARLETRQREVEFTADALDDLRGVGDPSALVEKLAEAGCGQPLVTTAEDILQRLREKMPSTN